MKPTVGLIGVGNMGKGMALNLLRAGHGVVVNDVRPEPVAELVAAGARAAASPREVGAAADPVIVMVLDFAQMDAVIFGPDGLVATLRPGATVIGCSTIAPRQAEDLAARLAPRGIDYIDAPVSGGKVGAEAGTLTVMAGAAPAVFADARPVLDAIAAQVYHTGPVGAGQVAKMCHQVMAGVSLVATAECLALAAASGLDRRLLYEIVTHGAGDGWMFRNRGERMLAGAADITSRLDIWAKDLGIILQAADRHHLPLLLVSAARQWVQMGIAEGRGAEDDSAVLKVMERLIGEGAEAG